MDYTINFHSQLETAVEIQFSNSHFLEVNIVKLETVGEDVLMINRIDDWLGEHPLLHAFHANPVNVVPKVLSLSIITNFLL